MTERFDVLHVLNQFFSEHQHRLNMSHPPSFPYLHCRHRPSRRQVSTPPQPEPTLHAGPGPGHAGSLRES
eukprot:759977-Hanusia_phi.AAC.6